ncbi:LVIVD repeat-containing protein [Hymenobacter rubripertinctus]|uniref:LVIVD repeat-containing protein n=1 Tax=Hymenobacter rubripertinctus TaxID=2029981 RepID=A0A418QP77_9BACT|nr:hypothetical protein [Hymenobacter rubripertinctus]RIY06932.1 hypothetical protein D0T11_17580 [Hymenobacter rubripertinctus]
MKNISTFLRLSGMVLSLLLTACSASNDASPNLAADNGQGGSLARFTVLGNTLFVVDNQNLRLFSLANPVAPAPGAVVPLGLGIETIYPRAPYLFLGTQRGMFIFDATLPEQPRQVAYYQHVASCDPVVVDDRYAYVTLRDGRSCGGGSNQLQVVDLTNLAAPRLAQTYPMTHPMGLGVDSTLLFVCDQNQLKVFDNRMAPVLPEPEVFPVNVSDVIPHRGLLLAIGPDGLYQYRYRKGQLTALSKLAVSPTRQ